MNNRKSTVTEINYLNKRVSESEDRLEKLRDQSKNIKIQIRDEERKLLRAKEKIKVLTEKSKDPIISDHAIIRYLERVKGLDLSEIKQSILNDKLKTMISTLGNGKFPCDDFTAIVKDNQVITIIEGAKK